MIIPNTTMGGAVSDRQAFGKDGRGSLSLVRLRRVDQLSGALFLFRASADCFEIQRRIA